MTTIIAIVLAATLLAAAEQKKLADGLPAAEAAKAMTVPPGFSVHLCAAEPDVKQPVAQAFDDRGRLWVAEMYAYPFRRPDAEAKDRILIFEDADKDGRFEKPKVFYEGLNLVSGIQVGFGGVWVGAAPYFMFIPDKNGDDVPDEKPIILLDGWGYQDTHETLNSFIWGPDGWLYGCHGVFTHSLVGKPNTPDNKRIPLNAAIWRYHPVRHEFEIFAHGTSNPWGFDFNDRGQSLLTCCVIPHLFQVIQGGRYFRQAGTHFNPYTYDDIKTIALHRHWAGGSHKAVSMSESDSNGGGHAHAGAMFYLGGSWPDEYRDKLFMNNIHGARLNVDQLRPKGSGYEGDRAPDFCLTHDHWSQIINLQYGPDGQLYMIDWYDRTQCHQQKEVTDRSNGRIFSIRYQNAKPVAVNLASQSDAELVALQLHRNDWYVRHARRLLMERSVAGKIDAATREGLAKIAFENTDETRRLRGLWALHVTGGLDETQVAKALADESPYVRGWTIQLLTDQKTPTSEQLAKLTAMAKADSAPIVRLYLASALQRLPLEQRWELAQALVAHGEDAKDHNLPLMYWYGIEPLATINAQKALDLAGDAKIPLLWPFMTRRVIALGTTAALDLVIEEIAKINNPQEIDRMLEAVRLALEGRRKVEMPKGWKELSEKLHASNRAGTRSLVVTLGLTFGEAKALSEVRSTVKDAAAKHKLRSDAIAALIKARDDQLPEILFGLLHDPVVRGEAIRGLAAFDHPETPKVLLTAYPTLSLDDRRDVLNTLSVRANYADRLIDAIAAKTVPGTDLSAEVVRQLRNLKSAPLTERLNKIWGVAKDTPAEKQALIKKYANMLSVKSRKTPGLAHGRAVFAKTCGQCHTLFETGGRVGPDLTGSHRANRDYLLSNVLDPSSVMAKEYQPTLFAMADGRVITGIVKQETTDAFTVVTATETLILPKGEVENQQLSEKSMMPDDLLTPLSEDEVRDLVAYLASPMQTPMMATEQNAASFFNGKDLSNWRGEQSFWHVSKGEIVGKSPGLKKNEFLKSEMEVGDFELTLQVKLTPDGGNSGVQFRSEAEDDGDVKGYQADIGAGYWGSLYEEHGRGALSPKTFDKLAKPGEWNDYRVLAVGPRIQIFINGQPAADVTDSKGAKRGIIALQLHSGGPMEIRFKDLKLTPLGLKVVATK